MIYKNFQDLQLSALGMGAMRLPTKRLRTSFKEVDLASSRWDHC